MNNNVYGQTMDSLKNSIDVRFLSNRKDYLKWTSKPSVCYKEYLTMI